jgi:hypothetical protein
MKIIDSPNVDCYRWQGGLGGQAMIVSNGTPSTGPQDIYCAPQPQGARPTPPKPDKIHYAGIPNPISPTYPYPYAFCAPASARGDNPSRFRDITLSPSNAGGYDAAVRQNIMYGSRLNNMITGFTIFTQSPHWLAGPAGWLGVSIEGRLFHFDNQGNCKTLAGFERNRAVLTIDPTDSTLAEAGVTRTLIGSFPAGIDLGGATDVVVDPRNDHVMYVLSQLDNWVAKVTLTGTSIASGVTAAVTVIAGGCRCLCGRDSNNSAASPNLRLGDRRSGLY